MDFLRSQGKKPQYEEEITNKYQVSKVGGSVSVSVEGEADRDALFDEAVRLFSKSNSASSSAIQRHLSVGYARAARILDQLEEAGFVGPAQGSQPIEVFRAKYQEHLASKELM
jgi:S-DNA-T family DNA segregation ATPase FtsK/SpoIIIE